MCLTLLVTAPSVYLTIEGFINTHGVTRSFLAQHALICPSSRSARKSTAAWGGLQTGVLWQPTAGLVCPQEALPAPAPEVCSAGRIWPERGAWPTPVCSVWPETGPKVASWLSAKVTGFLGCPLVAGSAPTPWLNWASREILRAAAVKTEGTRPSPRRPQWGRLFGSLIAKCFFMRPKTRRPWKQLSNYQQRLRIFFF